MDSPLLRPIGSISTLAVWLRPATTSEISIPLIRSLLDRPSASRSKGYSLSDLQHSVSTMRRRGASAGHWDLALSVAAALIFRHLRNFRFACLRPNTYTGTIILVL